MPVPSLLYGRVAMEDFFGTQADKKTKRAQAILHEPEGAYRRTLFIVVGCAAAVSLIPLFLMTVVNYHQYDRAVREDAKQIVRRFTSNNRRALEYFLEERLAALTYIVHDTPPERLRDDAELARILKNMNRSLPVGAFVDLGLIGADGNQVSYTGPFGLSGKNYSEQEWFHEVVRRRTYVSDVFLGFRQSPHFAIAILHDSPSGTSYVLRATINTQMLNDQILMAGLGPSSDCFIVNPRGVLQTPSRRYGNVLEACPLPPPPRGRETEVFEQKDEEGRPILLGTASIAGSPFILMLVKPHGDILGEWLSLRTELILLLLVSTGLILAVILWGSKIFVDRLKEADQRRSTLLHKVEYSNKLASVGRLAAGVAHEINNPLAVINEKAGLLKDLFTLSEASPPSREKTLGLVQSILKSVERCSAITHRLLGFGKHMDVHNETIDLPALIREILSLLEKEITDRNLQLRVEAPADVPTIQSDRGQLQQVFLNLINNAFAAVPDGGRIEIAVRRIDINAVEVSVKDHGVGIPKENLGKIFEPFFTTKKGYGTGLGLSITYGIVQKLGGQIVVESEVGKWTRFTVGLPVDRH